MGCPTAILISGSGTNLQSFIDQVKEGHLDLDLRIVFSNNPDAYGLQRALESGIPTESFTHRDFPSREAFDRAVAGILDVYEPQLIILAGFMRILTPVITENIKAINVHPSLLPLFKGGNAIRESFESSEPTGGISIHWVSNELDGGEILAQEAFQKEAGETLESFTAKIRTLEHKLLPETIVQILKVL